MHSNTPWLTEHQQRIWRLYLRGTARVSDHLDAQLRAHGLSLAEYEVLVALSEAVDHRMRMSDLASSVNQSRSRLTHAINRMERDGIVRRVDCSSDRRGVNAELTDEGFRLLTKLAPGHVRAVREVLVDAVDPRDYDALGRAMEAILKLAD